MRYFSTRDENSERPATLSEAIVQGAAKDGGLYLPESIPTVAHRLFEGLSVDAIAERGLAGFFEGDALEDDLHEIAHDALSFPVPLNRLEENLHVLELFHGPTAAFKDVGARFLAACMQRIPMNGARRTILVATSGDTGGAVAAAFYKRAGFDVIILFPDGRVSPLQAQQLSCWGENVRSFAVNGNFDDCQRLVKEAFANHDLCSTLGLSSANSINIGRLLPQIVYYLHAANLLYEEEGGPPGFIVPSGNLGNATACAIAKQMGARIGPVVLACNANRTVPDYFAMQGWRPRSSVTTLASAMDVGNPSNMERLRALFSDEEALRRELKAIAVSDEQISASIGFAFNSWGKAWCPHTATALYAYADMSDEVQQERPWVVVATAHAAKFAEVVEPIIGQNVEMPQSLAALMDRPAHSEALEPDISAFKRALS